MFSQDTLKRSLGWLALIVGSVAFIIAFIIGKEEGLWYDILIKIGDVLVIGAVIGYLTNTAQFLGIFKREIQNIVYGKDFVKVRNDLEEVWERVTREMFKSKFPAINRELMINIKQTYLPVANKIYYNDYNTTINIEWADKERRIIKVRHDINFELIAENERKITFPLKSWIDIDGLDSTDYSVKVLNYKVNDQLAKIISTTQEIKGKQHYFEQIVELKGCTKYEISKIIEKKYSLDKDFTIGFRALYITNKMTINFKCPDDISYLFYARGTIDEFRSLSDTNNSFTKKYKGLLFKNQGFIIALR